jgi:hypothetical protein
MITDDVKAGLVKGAGSKGIAVGFGLLGELKLADPSDALRELAKTVDSPGERTEFLNLFRVYLDTAPKKDGKISVSSLSNLGEGIANDGFEKGSAWIAANTLSEIEMTALTGSIGSQAKSGEKGQWIEWMGENLAGDGKERQIGSMMEDWTQSDYRAAGEWLAAAPSGSAKEISVSAYAETVAPHDPKTAVQWALTLPEGERRKKTLNAVYDNWPQDSPESRAERDAFMKKHPTD